MNWLWNIMNKPKLEVTFMDELKVFGFIILVVIIILVGFSVVSSWFEGKKP